MKLLVILFIGLTGFLLIIAELVKVARRSKFLAHILKSEDE